jgi:hypothetical protein
MNFKVTTPLWRARNHYWLVCGVISATVAGMPRRGAAARRGFVCVEVGAGGLIFRDDRSRGQAVELVAKPGLDLIFGKVMTYERVRAEKSLKLPKSE